MKECQRAENLGKDDEKTIRVSGKSGVAEILEQRMAKTVSDLFLIEEKNVWVWMPLEHAFVPVLEVAVGFEKSVLFHAKGLEPGKYVGVI